MTALPKRRNACAKPHPMGPAPMTSRRGGSLVSEKTVSFVRYPASASPGTDGAAALPPVAITARAKRSVVPPTSIASAATKRASPK